ncbi:cupin domain-containing protein [Candidatus Aerophobetes bacterium]|nr:cupin domain-containing protein [Candidatus Aerophobetes bacterium]
MQIKVVSVGEGERIDLGRGSWSSHLLNKNTVHSKKVMLGLSTFTPGSDTPQKIHTEEELCFVIKGKGSITVEGKEISYEAPSAIYIPPGAPHGVKNTGDVDVVMVYVFSHPEYPPTKDWKGKKNA